jgi:hypothetical protein
MELDPVTPTAKAPAERFTGDVYVNQVHPPHEPSRLIAGYVRFTPGARTNWHSHALGQTLVCTDGMIGAVTPGRDSTSEVGHQEAFRSTRLSRRAGTDALLRAVSSSVPRPGSRRPTRSRATTCGRPRPQCPSGP